MALEHLDFIWKLIPAGTIMIIVLGAYRFYSRHFLEIELHTDSAESFCYVLDSERNVSNMKYLYYAQLKAIVDISVGKDLGLEDVYFVLEDYNKLFQVSFSSPHAPQNVRDFFDVYGKEWESEDADDTGKTKGATRAKYHLKARGVAEQLGDAFPNLPEGGYSVIMVLMLKRFWVLVPCSFASLRDGSCSTIRGAARVYRRFGKNIDPIKLLKGKEDLLNKGESLCRLQLAILDFDFLPWSSLFKVMPIKKERV